MFYLLIEQTVELQEDSKALLERNKRDLFSAVSGIIGGTTGVLDTVSNGLSAVGSFFNVTWFSDFFVGILTVVSTFLKVVQAILGLLPLVTLIGEILLNLNYILSYLFSGNLFAVGVYVLNLVLAISTYPA